MMGGIGPNILRNYVGFVNQYWLADLMGFYVPPAKNSSRIDLMGDGVGVELKSRNSRYQPNWAIPDHQIVNYEREHPCLDLFGSFMIYDFPFLSSEVKTHDLRFFQKHITNRDIWFLPWTDIKSNFPVSETSKGKFRYPALKDFLEIEDFKNYSGAGYNLHIPVGSSLEKICDKIRK